MTNNIYMLYLYYIYMLNTVKINDNGHILNTEWDRTIILLLFYCASLYIQGNIIHSFLFNFVILIKLLMHIR